LSVHPQAARTHIHISTHTHTDTHKYKYRQAHTHAHSVRVCAVCLYMRSSMAGLHTMPVSGWPICKVAAILGDCWAIRQVEALSVGKGQMLQIIPWWVPLISCDFVGRFFCCFRVIFRVVYLCMCYLNGCHCLWPRIALDLFNCLCVVLFLFPYLRWLFFLYGDGSRLSLLLFLFFESRLNEFCYLYIFSSFATKYVADFHWHWHLSCGAHLNHHTFYL
jgi:hypothetical protein